MLEKSNVGGPGPPTSRLTVRCGNEDTVLLVKEQRDRQMDQSREPGCRPHTWSRLISDTGGEATQWGRDGDAGTGLFLAWTSTCQKHTYTQASHPSQKSAQRGPGTYIQNTKQDLKLE